MSATPPVLSGEELAELEAALGHRFACPEHLALAVTHPSIAGMERTAGRGYERLEFLGDRVLGLAVAEWLLERFPEEPEGALARRHTALVRAEALVRVAEEIGLGRFLRLAPGEQETGGRTKPAILADACEAVIAALYLDGGLEAARAFIRRHWTDQLSAAGKPPQDPKTALQEWTLGRGLGLPVYETVSQSGPDHAPIFEVRVRIEGGEAVTATGPSKRAAEKIAAELLLSRIRT